MALSRKLFIIYISGRLLRQTTDEQLASCVFIRRTCGSLQRALSLQRIGYGLQRRPKHVRSLNTQQAL